MKLKKPTPYIPLESEEQKVFVQWLELKKIKFTSVPNSTWTPSMAQKVKNKAMGLRSGFPDMIVALPNYLLCIELKRRKGGVVSQEQKDWIAALNLIPNVEARVCFGADEAIKFVEYASKSY